MMDFKSDICFLNKHNTASDVFKKHSHNCYEIVYFLKGKGVADIGGKNYEISTNSCIIIPPHTQHVERLENYGEILFIGFNFESDTCKLDSGSYFDDGNAIFLMFDKIFKEFKNQDVCFRGAANSFLDLIIINLLRDTFAQNKKCKDLNHIKNYIEQHIDQKINFKELAAVSGYSVDYFRHIFKQRFGVSPQQYMINIRLDRAREMLENTDFTCTEIAYNCGFSNASQMTVMFKKTFGISPKEFKKTDLYKN